MEEEVVHCNNCKRDVSAKNYVIHSVHCERNIQLCVVCSEPVPRSEQKNHEEEFHSQEPCSECGILVEKWQIEKHKEMCYKKLVSCEYCELEVTLDNIAEHMAACGSRTEQCTRCKKHVMKKDLKEHPINCSRKEKETVPCEYCYGQIDIREFEEHTILCESRTERCVLCSQHVMMKDKETHSVTCGKEKQLESEIPCKYCGKLIVYKSMGIHAISCEFRNQDGDKQNELKNIGINSNQVKENMSKTYGSCVVCRQSVPWVDMNVHTAMCAQIHYEDREYERQNKLNEYTESKESEGSVDEGSTKEKAQSIHTIKRCSYCFELFPNSKLPQHLKVCQERPYNCEKCLKAMPDREKIEHVGRCRARRKKGQHHTDYFQDEEETADNRDFKKLRKCQFCGKKFTDVLFQYHTEECEHREEKCDLCSQNVCVKDMQEHKFLKCHFTNQAENKISSYYSEAIPEPFMDLGGGKGYLETNVEECPSCHCKIPEERYNKHLHLCYEKKTKCHFCGMEIKKDSQHSHIGYCSKVLELVKSNNSEKKKREAEKNEERGSFSLRSWLPFIKDKKSGSDRVSEVFEKHNSSQSNRGYVHEKVNTTPVPLPSEFNVPCEFCNEMWPFELIIEHQSGCRPDLVSFPKSHQENVDQEIAAAASVTQFSRTPVLGANPQTVKEDANEWKEVSRKNRLFASREDTNSRKGERNTFQKQLLSNKDKLFYYTSQPSIEVPESQSASSNKGYPQLRNNSEVPKKQYSQRRESAEFSNTDSDGEVIASCEVKPSKPGNCFTSFKFFTNESNEDNQNDTNLCKELNSKDKLFSHEPQHFEEAPKSQSYKKRYLQLEKGPETSKQYSQWGENPEKSNTNSGREIVASCEVKDYPKEDPFTSFKFSTTESHKESQNDTNLCKIDGQFRAIGCEALLKKKRLSKKVDNKDFEEMSLEQLIASEENRTNEPLTFPETNENVSSIWNTEYLLSSDNTSYSNRLKSIISSYKNESATLSSAVENIEKIKLNANIQDTNYDERNAETFGSDFVESIDDGLKKEDESDTLSNSDDYFFDADDGVAKFVDIVNDNVHSSSITQDEKLNHDYLNLNLSSGFQRENLGNSNYDNMNVSTMQEEVSHKDSDLKGYYQFLFKSIEKRDDSNENKLDDEETVSPKEKTFFNASSSKETSVSTSSSGPLNMEVFVAKTRASLDLESKKKFLELEGEEKVDSGNFAMDETEKWKKWRTSEAFDSD